MDDHMPWDLQLQIQTSGLDDKDADEYRYPYEPTPYCVLERLSLCGLIGGEDTVLDYGCGKGRVGFFLSDRTGAHTIGLECNNRIFAAALENRSTAVSGEKTDFVLTGAETYSVPREVNRCYFFNPFSVELLCKVLARILDSYYAYPREIFLFFYYPSDEYISHLMTTAALEFYKEIRCDDLFPGKDARERILIFQLPFGV